MTKKSHEFFCLKLTEVGNYYCRGNYAKDSDSNALKLIARATRTLCRDIGEKLEAQMRFEVAVLLLKSLKFEKEDLEKALLEDSEKAYERWEVKKDILEITNEDVKK